jgi:hypothetical protein
MLHREVITVCSENHTEYINAICGHYAEICMLNFVANGIITRLKMVKYLLSNFNSQ